eukprot:scaffold20509_cov11-Tisochrysis_lutea.AAC.1
MEFFKASIGGVSYGAGITEVERSNAERCVLAPAHTHMVCSCACSYAHVVFLRLLIRTWCVRARVCVMFRVHVSNSALASLASLLNHRSCGKSILVLYWMPAHPCKELDAVRHFAFLTNVILSKSFCRAIAK